jgi:endonuclease/exonuclease/phosphatase family metal-dependent hydrolase
MAELGRGWRVRTALCLLLAGWVLGRSAEAQALPVRVAAWNVFDLPEWVFSLASAKRMQQVPEALAALAAPVDTLDAVVFSELYVAQDRALVLTALARWGLVHRAALVGSRFVDRAFPAGLVIASRWPIEAQASMGFRHACHGADCLTTKGALYVRLRKQVGSKTYPVHLFGTHFYLGQPPADVVTRLAQAASLAQFIRQQAILPTEPVVLAGDLNAPWEADGPTVLAALGSYPVTFFGALDHTFCGHGHPLAGSPFQSLKQRCRQAQTRQPPNEQAGRKWIDYVVALAPGARPQQTRLTVLPARGLPYLLGSADSAHCLLEGLSDHYPVLGEFDFP